MAVYQLLQGVSSLNNKTAVQGEANFILRKLSYALSGASTVSIQNSSVLTITRYDNIQADVCLGVSDVNPQKKAIRIREVIIGTPFVACDSSFTPITTDNVTVNSLQFINIGSNPPGVSIAMDIDGQSFELTKYLRR